MQPTLRLFATAALAFAFTAVSLRGQATSQIQGIVTDSTGGAVADVQITATQTQTGEVRKATSDSAGNYVFPSLPIGPYQIEAAKAGFSTLQKPGIVLEVVLGRTVNFSLLVSITPQIITVAGDATRVDTQTTSIANIIDKTRIDEIPLNGRKPE